MVVAYRRADIPVATGSRGFVATMGALHRGHQSLIEHSVSENSQTIVSIFVNPTQFGPNEDFSRYPRTLVSDLEIAKAAGADVVYVPEVAELYSGDNFRIQLKGQLNGYWEAPVRPFHFDGVATVVLKLLNIVRSDIAYFGQKDLQQCAVIQKMVQEFFVPTVIKTLPTVREIDGLAMSSRNRYLSAADRELAPLIFQTLTQCKNQLILGADVADTCRFGKATLLDSGFDVDYFAVVDMPSMSPSLHFNLAKPGAIVVAARLGSTRLIDNVVW
jgi:pantoate--beta-alanine ligase